MKCTGQLLFDEVVGKLRLLESDYFDLEYTDVHRVSVSIEFIAVLLITKSVNKFIPKITTS